MHQSIINAGAFFWRINRIHHGGWVYPSKSDECKQGLHIIPLGKSVGRAFSMGTGIGMGTDEGNPWSMDFAVIVNGEVLVSCAT